MIPPILLSFEKRLLHLTPFWESLDNLSKPPTRLEMSPNSYLILYLPRKTSFPNQAAVPAGLGGVIGPTLSLASFPLTLIAALVLNMAVYPQVLPFSPQASVFPSQR